MGLEAGFWPISDFWNIYVVFIVEFDSLAYVDGINLIMVRFGAFGDRVQRRGHPGVGFYVVKVSNSFNSGFEGINPENLISCDCLEVIPTLGDGRVGVYLEGLRLGPSREASWPSSVFT